MTMSRAGILAIVTLLTAIASAASIWAISLWGFGTSPDSIVYVAGARSLAGGLGFSLPSSAGVPDPIVQFPPFFSAMLAMFSFLGTDPLDGATILNAGLFALTICLSAALVFRSTGIATAAFFAALLTLTAPAMLTTHTMVWSEPLFLFLLLVTAWAISHYQQNPSYISLAWVLPSTLVAPLTRYAGVAVILAAVLSIARKNLRHAIVLTIAASAGAIAWLARNYALTSSTTNRAIGFHPPDGHQLTLAFQTITEWFGGSLLAIALIILLAVTILARSQTVKSETDSNFLIMFSIIYALLLALTISFADAQTPLDRRILSPLYVALSLWLITAITPITSKPMRLIWSAAAVSIIAVNCSASLEWLKVLSTQGVGFSSSAWRISPTINYLRTHQVTPLHTNAPDPVSLLVGTPATMLPRHTDPGTRVANAEYSRQMAVVKNHGGVVVYFRAVKWRWYLPDEERLKTDLNARQVVDLGDGAVYAIEPAAKLANRN